ncbi:DUF4058 family protein [Iningainema tapete]|uniref:DUF4058 family protein n=1 Tax=Iningainema tapete BLCC-T55 TaxID=2748662 RepID=A0A8J6XGU4_9CYAN|nr:DUF4058 family protein [Iningainema tapete]MBD2772272.1 DUF4058 family protein [Iningainema tapete BLCC-T55]
MPSPFPGMNPYLENPALWKEVHNLLIVAIFDALNPKLRPKYRVAIEQRVYQTAGDNSLLVGIPDVAVQRSQTALNPKTANIAIATPPVQAMTVTIPMPETIRESYLSVREVTTREVVTVIEVLSPKNKRAGEGRRAYEKKRRRVLGSFTNLVEIDLLRDGKQMRILSNDTKSDYRILVSRGEYRPKADLYAFNLQDVIPEFPLPLREEDVEPIVNLQTLLTELYDRASYDLVIDYSIEPVPPLPQVDAVWADKILQEKGLR